MTPKDLRDSRWPRGMNRMGLPKLRAALTLTARSLTDQMMRNPSGKCWDFPLFWLRDDLLAAIKAKENRV